MNAQNEILEIMGCHIAIKYATQKDAGISLGHIEEMLLSAHLQVSSTSHPCQNSNSFR